MGRYERIIQALQEQVDDGNGSWFSGTASCTTKTMHDIEKLDEAMQNENSQLRNECEKLKKENHQLMEEIAH